MLGAVVCLGDIRARPDRIHEVAITLQEHCSRVLFAGAEADADLDQISIPVAATELGALTAVLRLAEDDHAVIAAGDLRRPSSALLRYMIQIRGSFEIVAPQRSDGTVQPLLALYHAKLRRRAEGLAAAGEREICPLLDLASVRLVTPEEVAKFGDPDGLVARFDQSCM